MIQEKEKEENYNAANDTNPEDESFGYYAPIEDDEPPASAGNEDNEKRKSREDKPGQGKPKMRPTAWRLMLSVLSNPIEGWKSVRRNKLSPMHTRKECFYPLVCLVGITEFAEMYYNPGVSLLRGVVDAVGGFISMFFSYFAIGVIGKILLPGIGKDSLETPFGKVFVMISLSTLCVFYSLLNLLPMLEPMLVFLPLWTVYIICRGIRFLRYPPEREHLFTAILCLLIVGMPSLIGWLFAKIVTPI